MGAAKVRKKNGMYPTTRKETPQQKKLRLAQELIAANKKSEQDQWRAKWETQSKDPEYQRKQAERRATSDERSRKMAIGKENAQLARTGKLVAEAGLGAEDLEHIAYHEAGHAVIHEVLSSGVNTATIIPEVSKRSGENQTGETVFNSLGRVIPNSDDLPIGERQRALHRVAGLLAGGMATEYAQFDAWGTEGDYKQIVSTLKELGLDSKDRAHVIFEARELCTTLMDDPKIWSAIKEVKEGLLTEKSLSGQVIRAIVKKQERPGSFPIEMTKQLSFHYRKNFYNSYYVAAPYSLGIGEHHQGFTLTNPLYVEHITKANVQPLLLLVPRAEQFDLFSTTNVEAHKTYEYNAAACNADKKLRSAKPGSKVKVVSILGSYTVTAVSREGSTHRFSWDDGGGHKIPFTIEQDRAEFYCEEWDARRTQLSNLLSLVIGLQNGALRDHCN